MARRPKGPLIGQLDLGRQASERGRRLELDGLSGAVIRLGRETGVPTPVHATVYAALKPFMGGAPDSGS